MVILKRAVLLLSCALLSSCHFTYLVKGGYYQAKILSRQESIKKVIESSDTKTEVKKKLELATRVLTFIENNLGLETKGNYQTYVQLDDRYVTWAVTAAQKYKLKAYMWSFPLIGEVPYKGFFLRQDADDEAAALRRQGYDTLVRGVSAFSTLGWLRDPILSSMLNTRDEDFVNTLIHETVHANLYVKSAADFNEQLATFLGNKGAEAFFMANSDMTKAALQYARDTNNDEKTFSIFLTKEIKGLEEFYARTNPITESMKVARLREIQERFKKEVRPKIKTGLYSTFGENELNNAILISYKTYLYDLGDFEKVFQAYKGNFKDFFTFCKTLENSKDPRADFLK